MRARTFKPGDMTNEVWSGDVVTDCEYIRSLGRGAHLFYDHTILCFRRVFWDVYATKAGHPSFVLNGWENSNTPFKS